MKKPTNWVWYKVDTGTLTAVLSIKRKKLYFSINTAIGLIRYQRPGMQCA